MLLPEIKRLDLGCLALPIERQDIDRRGVGGEDIEEVVAREARDGVVDRGRPGRKRVLLDDFARQVVRDRDLGHDVRLDVRQEERPRLRREARPARRALPRDREHLARRRAPPRAQRAQVERREADPRVRREHRVLPRDEAHRERDEPALGRGARGEVGGERAVVRDVPARDEPGRRGDALDGDEQPRRVLAEEDVGHGPRGPRRRRRLRQLEGAVRVRQRDQAELRVWLEALHAVDRAAVDDADHLLRGGERDRGWEFAFSAHWPPNHLELGWVVRVNVEHHYGIGARLESV